MIDFRSIFMKIIDFHREFPESEGRGACHGHLELHGDQGSPLVLRAPGVLFLVLGAIRTVWVVCLVSIV